MRTPYPTPVYGRLAAPEGWQALGAAKQQARLALDLLEALEALKPRLHRSLVGGRLLEATGTTIAVTALANENTFLVPWDYGEEPREILRRFVQVRRFFTSLPAATVTAYLQLLWPLELPPPQAHVSVVGHLGIEEAVSAIGASAGTCPLAIVADQKSVSFCFDHRCYDPIHCADLYRLLREKWRTPCSAF